MMLDHAVNLHALACDSTDRSWLWAGRTPTAWPCERTYPVLSATGVVLRRKPFSQMARVFHGIKHACFFTSW